MRLLPIGTRPISGVRVSFSGESATADRLIVTAGAWSSRMLAALGLPLNVLRKTLFWLEVENPEIYESGRMPAYIAGIPGYEFYGFPTWGEPGIKVAIHSGGDAADPDSVNREVSDDEKAEIVRVADQVLNGITGTVLRATTCLYTVTPDHNFIVDQDARYIAGDGGSRVLGSWVQVHAGDWRIAGSDCIGRESDIAAVLDQPVYCVDQAGRTLPRAEVGLSALVPLGQSPSADAHSLTTSCKRRSRIMNPEAEVFRALPLSVRSARPSRRS